MSILEKVSHLGAAGKYDVCASTASPRKSIKSERDRIGDAAATGICHSFTEDGRCVALFKTLYTNACKYDCKYCANSTSCKEKKQIYKYEPEELAKTFMHLYIRNYVEGLFLSSGIASDQNIITENMLECVNLLRNKYNFRGYIHFKVLPGVNYELIKQASEISDRLSINLESPNKSRLSEVSSTKDFKSDILKRQAWISRMKLPAGQTTQLVVGTSDETDLEILKMVDWEYENFNLKRGYYSAFLPVAGTPLQFKNKAPLQREHRLYNVDFMLRKYNFKLKEFEEIMNNGMLPKEDPKLALAKATLDRVDINESKYDALLRVPGIGPSSARRITELQKQGKKITRYRELHNIGVVLKRAKSFIDVDGKIQKRIGEFNA